MQFKTSPLGGNNTSQRKKYYMTKRRIKEHNIQKTYRWMIVITLITSIVGVWAYFWQEDHEVSLTGEYVLNINPAKANTEEVEKEKTKVYAYNELVPKEIIKKEIIRQANLFSLDPDKMVELAKCESGLNNLVHNQQGSSAKGVYQFINSTWANTVSGRKHISVYDYVANIREAMLLISLGRTTKEWRDCSRKLGLTDF